MKNDIEYEYFIDSFAELIKDGFINGDNRLLRGIQTFDISTYSHLEGIESIISVMFTLTIDARIEAKDLERRLQQDKEYYEEIGTYEKMIERLNKKKNGEIQFFLIKNACSGLKNVIKSIFLLQEEGYIEIIGDEIEQSYLKLSSIWDDFIEYTVKQGYESEIYGSSISRMIASALLKKGFRLIRPIVKALLDSETNGGEINPNKFQKLFEENYLEYRHFTNLIERDQKKPKDIKLIHYRSDSRILFNKASLYSVKKWLNLAKELKIKEEREL
jgi:hypothetical protein